MMNINDILDSETVRRMQNFKTGKEKEIIFDCLEKLLWELDGTKITHDKNWTTIHVTKGRWSEGDPTPFDINIRGDNALGIVDDVMRELGIGTPRDYYRLREKYDAYDN
jgi:hypothetical protein